MSETRPMVGVRKLAELLDVSVDYVYDRVSPDADPADYWEHYRFGRYIRFDEEQVAAIRASHKHTQFASVPASEPDASYERALQRLRRDKAA